MAGERPIRSLRRFAFVVASCAIAITTSASFAQGLTSAPMVTVVLRAQGAGAVTIGSCHTCTFRVHRGSILTASEAPAVPFAFAGWSGDCVGVAPSCVFIADIDPVVVTAAFVRKTVTVDASVGGEGTINSDPKGIDCGVGGSTCSFGFGAGTTIALTEVPQPGYSFVGWQRGCTNTSMNVCSVALPNLGGSQVTAVFRNATFTFLLGTRQLTTEVAGHIWSHPSGVDCSWSGGPTAAVCSRRFPVGTVVELYGESAWSGACVGSASSCPVILDTDLNVQARHALVPTFAQTEQNGLRINVTGGALVRTSGTEAKQPVTVYCSATNGNCNLHFDHGSQVTLVAPRHLPGLRFAFWRGYKCGGSGNPTCQFEISQTGTINAVYNHVHE